MIFSKDSDTTLVVTSCGRFDLLRRTLESFDRYNTAPIREVFITEDSGDSVVESCRGVWQEFIPLPARRDVRVVEGFFNDIMQGPATGERSDDYLSFLLLDEAPVIQAVHRLRTIYPKTMEINYRYQQNAASLHSGQRPDHRALSSMELFESFAEWSTQKPLTDLQRKTIAPFLAPVDGEGGER